MTQRRRRRRPRVTPVIAGVAGVLWLWSQWWGRGLLVSVAIVAGTAGIAYVALAPRRHRGRKRRLATLDGLLDLTPSEFEHEVAALLQSHGFRSVSVTGSAGDLQADIVATDPDGRFTI